MRLSVGSQGEEGRAMMAPTCDGIPRRALRRILDSPCRLGRDRRAVQVAAGLLTVARVAAACADGSRQHGSATTAAPTVTLLLEQPAIRCGPPGDRAALLRFPPAITSSSEAPWSAAARLGWCWSTSIPPTCAASGRTRSTSPTRVARAGPGRALLRPLLLPAGRCQGPRRRRRRRCRGRTAPLGRHPDRAGRRLQWPADLALHPGCSQVGQQPVRLINDGRPSNDFTNAPIGNAQPGGASQ
jgi:hypothetical protein